MYAHSTKSATHLSSFQHRYQDEVERSLIGAGGGYIRPSSRSQANQRERERERDRQLLQEALSLYLASAQPSYRHRGPASMAPAGEPSCQILFRARNNYVAHRKMCLKNYLFAISNKNSLK